jgi:CheY-like chemotaxis protein
VQIPVQYAAASEVIGPEAGQRRRVVALERGQPLRRILIVEDQLENRQLLQRLAGTAGFDVEAAEDGARAVDAFAAWRPDFIWMDVGLPVLSGPEAVRRIRTMDGGRSVKIAAVTASAFDTDRDAVLAAGFDDLVRKPFHAHQIFDCMARHLGVTYVYATDQEPETLPQATLRPQDLAALPDILRADLEEALLSLDYQRISQVVARVSEQHQSAGRALQSLADNLTYSPILTALRGPATSLRPGTT